MANLTVSMEGEPISEGKRVIIPKREEDEFLFQRLFANQRKFDGHCNGVQPRFQSTSESRALITAGETAECDQTLLGIYVKKERIWVWSWVLFPDKERILNAKARLSELELAQHPYVYLESEHAQLWLFAYLSTFLELDHIVQLPVPDEDEHYCVLGLSNIAWRTIEQNASAEMANPDTLASVD